LELLLRVSCLFSSLWKENQAEKILINLKS